MNITRTPGNLRRTPSSAAALPVIGMCILMLLSGCTSVAEQETGFDQVTVKPGQTATCESRPCKIKLERPAGSGTFEVTGNESKLGDYPAGQTVELGGFWNTQAIKIKGTEARAAYVYIPSR